MRRVFVEPDETGPYPVFHPAHGVRRQLARATARERDAARPGVSQYLGSYVANYASVPQSLTDPVATLPLYTRLFNGLGLVATGGTVLAVAMLPLMRRLSAPGPAPAP